jgi:hypothetical protein
VTWGRGRIGSCGGASPPSVPGLLGGLLNGEASLETLCFLGVVCIAGGGSGTKFLSRRGAGGGGGCLPSLLNSPDLRGGGGEGGLEARGDLGGGGAGVGVVGRNGGLKLPLLGLLGLVTESGLRNLGLSSATMAETLLFGGDCGGWIVTAGGSGFGASGLAAGIGLEDGGGAGGVSVSVCSGSGSGSGSFMGGGTAGFGLGLEGTTGVVGVDGAGCAS